MSFAATWMDLEIIILSELSQLEKDKYHMISLVCGILKIKNDTNGLIYKIETNSQTLRTNLPKGKGDGEGKIRSLGLTDTHYYIYNRSPRPTI